MPVLQNSSSRRYLELEEACKMKLEGAAIGIIWRIPTTRGRIWNSRQFISGTGCNWFLETGAARNAAEFIFDEGLNFNMALGAKVSALEYLHHER